MTLSTKQAKISANLVMPRKLESHGHHMGKGHVLYLENIVRLQVLGLWLYRNHWSVISEVVEDFIAGLVSPGLSIVRARRRIINLSIPPHPATNP